MATTIERPREAQVIEREVPEVGGPAGEGSRPAKPERLVSLDAFRGFIMMTLAAGGFGFATLADTPGWGWLAEQFRHVSWEGMVYWDLIQPAFMFMVGLAMPYSVAHRRGQPASVMFRHVLWRAFVLIVLSQVLISIGRGALSFQLINVLAQIGLAYLMCYAIMQLPFGRQAMAAGGLLAFHWALFALFPGPEGAFSKEGNIGAVIDGFLGLHYSGYYVTINFISSGVTMLFGVWAGYLMRAQHPHAYRMKVLAGAIAGCFIAGWGLTLFNPMVKRIWTASFTFASGGCVLAILLAFYWLVEVKGYRKLAFPLVVVGMNSIFVYCMHMIQHGWLDRAVGTFTGKYEFLGAGAPIAQHITVFLVIWYLCYWLYQRRIFLRI